MQCLKFSTLYLCKLETPLSSAISTASEQIVRDLLKRGATIDDGNVRQFRQKILILLNTKTNVLF